MEKTTIVDEFIEYLKGKYPDSSATVATRISNFKKVTKYYGPLEEVYHSNQLEELIEQFNYSKTDEKGSKEQSHKIPIKGNVYSNSQTYKQTIRLFQEFADLKYSTLQTNQLIEKSNNKNYSKVTKAIKKFNMHLYMDNNGRIKDVTQLQLALTDFLQDEIPKLKWEVEFQPDDIKRDSVDIYGVSGDVDEHIVIELDSSRADQVAKKFLSRFALFRDENMIYIAVCYPGTASMNSKECIKYFEYCSQICSVFNSTSSLKKEFAGIFLVK